MVSQDANLPPPGPVDFSTLILGLSSAALYYLGETSLEGQPAPKGVKNVALAKHNIDIIILLRDKTRGNLTADESHLIDQLVADLQLKLVDASR